MFHVKHKNIYELLYKLALKSYKNDEIPVGSIVIYKDNIIGKGFNTRQSKCDVCGHAEVNAIRMAEKKLNDWRLNDCILITTLKPCSMCNEIIKASRISEVYYIFEQDKTNYENNYIIIDDKDEYISKIEKLFNDFFKKLR